MRSEKGLLKRKKFIKIRLPETGKSDLRAAERKMKKGFLFVYVYMCPCKNPNPRVLMLTEMPLHLSRNDNFT